MAGVKSQLWLLLILEYNGCCRIGKAVWTMSVSVSPTLLWRLISRVTRLHTYLAFLDMLIMNI